ncbi:alpha/beta hydrolase [Lewinella sp. 4G2]|uniref:alpha/beta hydrolase n=1 Tax=Lewinella sp. 4G2 TaxID=1803372 RepID=UPI0007B49E00|nr:alpha/beta hydrolase [Lewinella sp. 4G2]OAV43943.1 hypothetical protein A3850_005300 [Lewinella sp. 4G2]
MRYLLLFFAVLLIGQSCSESDPAPIPPAVPEERQTTIQYGQAADPNLVSLDLYYSSAFEALKPVVVYVHGGAWVTGDKANNISDKVDLFREEDYLFASVNYRLSPFPFELDNDARIKYPVHNNDVAEAIAWIHENVADFGGDPDRIVLMGHSAGAQLISLLATRREFLEDAGVPFSAIRGAISVDTEGYDVRERIVNNADLYRNAFGDDPAVHAAASPLLNVMAGLEYPQFLVLTRGTVARQQRATDFHTALRNAGVESELFTTVAYTHEGINEAIGQRGEAIVTPEIVRFVADCVQ